MSEAPVFCVVDQNLKDLVGHHFEYDRACVEGARAHGFQPVCLGHRDAIPVVADGLPLRRSFSRGMWWLPDGEDRETAIAEANRLFLAELNSALANLALDGSSVVFGHMIVHGQLEAWSRFVQQRAGPDGPQVVLLLRYQPAFYQGPSCERAFRALEASVAAGARVRLASDSARLSGQIERLTRLPVETFPIPHTSDAHGTTIRAPGPLRVVSLGNARDEKGILELFDAAQILELRGDGHGLELVLQVNDPNPEIAPAVERFLADPPSNVRLICEALPTEAYAALLASADIVATPYWRSIYEARTSGVFLEAVAAGKPVICTAETWMSDELVHAGAGIVTRDRDAPALASALIEARDRFAELSAKAMADRPKWLAFHNAGRLVDALLHGAPPAARPPELRAAVLFPWGDDLVTPASGAANRVRPVIDLLTRRCTQVRVLQDVNRAPCAVDGASFETDPLLERAQKQLWYRLAQLALKALGARNGEEVYILLHMAAERDAAFRARVMEVVEWADLVLLEYPFWARVVREACDRRGKRFVLTSHDVIADQCRSSPVLRALTRRLERRALALADRRLAISPADVSAFEAAGLATDYSPTGLDVDLLRIDPPGDARGLLNALCGWPVDDRTPLLLFMGSKFRPNALAAEAVARMAGGFARAYPASPVRFVVAGACHPPGRSEMFQALGFVDALTGHLLRRQCALVLAPLSIGTGVSLKSYEALACGQALLSTSIGLRGIEGWEEAAVLEDDLKRWPERIMELLGEPERCAALRAAACRRGDEMDYRRTGLIYLEAAGAQPSPPFHPDPAPERRRAFLLEAARAADRLDLPETSQACIAEAATIEPAGGAAMLLSAQRSAEGVESDPDAAMQAIQLSLRNGADPVEALRQKARILAQQAGPQGVHDVLARAARLAVSRWLAERREPALREAAWDAYHGGDMAWALALAQEVLKGWPSLADSVSDYDYLCASILADRVDIDPAVVEEHARRALELGFDAFWCWMILAQAQRRRGADDLALLQAYSLALTAAGVDQDRRQAAIDVMVSIAWNRFEAGQYKRAGQIAERVIAKASDTASALYLAGEVRKKLRGAPRDALDFFQRAELAGFDSGWCRTHMAELRLALDEPQVSVDVALSALAASGADHRATAEACVCAGLWVMYEAASPMLAAYALRAVEAGVQDGRVWYLRGEALARTSDPVGAWEAYSRAIAAGFDPYWALRRRAEVAPLANQDGYGDRLAAAEAAPDPQARIDVLAPLLQTQRDGLSREHIAEIIRVGGGAETLIALAEVSKTTPDPSGAKAEIAAGQSAQAAPLQKPGREVDRLWRVFEARDYEKTLQLAQELARSHRRPARAHGNYLVAECLQLLDRDLPTALGHYGAALELGFEAYWAHFNRAQLHAKLGDVDAARTDLHAAAAAAANAERVEAALASLAKLSPPA